MNPLHALPQPGQRADFPGGSIRCEEWTIDREQGGKVRGSIRIAFIADVGAMPGSNPAFAEPFIDVEAEKIAPPALPGPKSFPNDDLQYRYNNDARFRAFVERIVAHAIKNARR